MVGHCPWVVVPSSDCPAEPEWQFVEGNESLSGGRKCFTTHPAAAASATIHDERAHHAKQKANPAPTVPQDRQREARSDDAGDRARESRGPSDWPAGPESPRSLGRGPRGVVPEQRSSIDSDRRANLTAPKCEGTSISSDRRALDMPAPPAGRGALPGPAAGGSFTGWGPYGGLVALLLEVRLVCRREGGGQHGVG